VSACLPCSLRLARVASSLHQVFGVLLPSLATPLSCCLLGLHTLAPHTTFCKCEDADRHGTLGMHLACTLAWCMRRGATVFEAFLREGHVYLFKLALAIVEGIEAQLMTAQVRLAPPLLPPSLMVATCSSCQAYAVADSLSRRTRLWSC